jgi:hypothetical protein
LANILQEIDGPLAFFLTSVSLAVYVCRRNTLCQFILSVVVRNINSKSAPSKTEQAWNSLHFAITVFTFDAAADDDDDDNDYVAMLKLLLR